MFNSFAALLLLKFDFFNASYDRFVLGIDACIFQG